jgi:type I restriction enzyme S subunit
MLALKKYSKYKESGLPWLGSIPAHWSVRRAKQIFIPIDIRSKDGNEELLTVSSKDSVLPRSQKKVTMFKAESYVGYKLCWPGDLVINSLWAWARGLGFSRYHGIVSSAYGVYRPKPQFASAFPYFDYLLRSDLYNWELHVRSKGIWVSRLQLTDESFFDMPIVVPPVDEAEKIAAYIKVQDLQIRKLIRAKRRVIELLNEQKQAIILRAVTRGFDPNVRLMPSGIEWLGAIPAHWETKRLKWVTRLQRGYDLPSERRLPGPVPVVSSGGIIGSHREARAEAPGVVMGRYGSTDSVFYLEEPFWPHNTSLFVTDFQGNFPRWCYYLLRVVAKVDLGSKSAVPGVDRKDLYEISVAVPPVREQPSIVEQTENRLSQFEKETLSVQRQIDLLREYRTRLIADVVTGKLDVRGVELPELNDVEEVSDLVDEELEDSQELEAVEESTDAD